MSPRDGAEALLSGDTRSKPALVTLLLKELCDAQYQKATSVVNSGKVRIENRMGRSKKAPRPGKAVASLCGRR